MALIKETDHLCIQFQDIKMATKNFATLIGKGGYGNVYEGELSLSGKLTTVAVKRLDPSISGQGFKEFLTEIHLLSRYKHPNLVSLLGFCHEGKEKILVYEHAKYGSLDKFISMDTAVCPLTCKQKIDICIDAACGLDYLHNHAAENHRVIHRDVKSANILLDHNWKAMISDLGLSKIGRANECDTFLITNICGTHGYCDPVYRDTGVLTKESDVYSFGVVLFEVLCGRLCFLNVNDERMFLDCLVQRYYKKGKLHEIIDPVMKEQLPSDSLDMILEIAYQCLSSDREKRPSIGLVVKKLKDAAEMLEMNMVGETRAFGLNDDIKSLVRRLIHPTEMFVPIVGKEGTGKTTLAVAVYENRKMKDHFEFHDWIYVTENQTAEHILPSLLKKMVMVQGKRYLIVIDGVGSYNVLQDLKDAFLDENNGSKIIFTSRRISKLKKLNPHVMNRLNDYQSWKMFLNRAGKEKEADEITAKLKGKILSICNGSPQNIVLVAGLLSNNEIKRWPTVIDDGQCPDDVLRICYNDLSIHLKLCLLYLAVFPKDYKFRVRRLLRLWLAVGFINLRLQDLFPEDSVQDCFEKLVVRNIIQITKLRSDNSPRRCRLVPVFHDYLLQKAQHIGLFYILLYPENFKDAAGPLGVGLVTQYIITKRVVDPSPLRSYVSFNFQPKDMLEKQEGRAFGRIIRSDFALLCHLRFLGLRRICLKSLPESVGYVSFLKNLTSKQIYNIKILPNSNWELKQLRHLNLNNICFNESFPLLRYLYLCYILLPSAARSYTLLKHVGDAANLQGGRLLMKPLNQFEASDEAADAACLMLYMVDLCTTRRWEKLQ